MTDLENILSLWRVLQAAGSDYVLATVVDVDGPSYRKPGARMLIAPDGRRAGTVSGGCLEAEVAKRAFWMTESGPVVQRYSTAEDDGDMPYGSGCGGVVYVLLERRATAASLLTALEAAFYARLPIAIATILDGTDIARRELAGPTVQGDCAEHGNTSSSTEILRNLAALTLERMQPIDQRLTIGGAETRVWVDYCAARPGLWIFGAGDDAKPLHRMARELGWFVSIADGRSHLATRERFPGADTVTALPISTLPQAASSLFSDVKSTDAAVLMTHSFEQDSLILAGLFAGGVQPAYVGVLGPQRRTREVLNEVARMLGLPDPAEQAEHWLSDMHAPTGLDLGAETPAAIALSIIAEVQQKLNNSSAMPLRQVRAVHPAKSQAQSQV
jgi:xanthine/CO dehydrogenase XdhC/CoxF family maturation factor